MNVIDFRDSLFPYIGLILMIVILLIVLIPALTLNYRKVLFWSSANFLGYFIGWGIFLLVATPLANLILNQVALDKMSGLDRSVIIPVINQISGIIWFLSFLLLWNILIGIPVYFFIYKRLAFKKDKTHPHVAKHTKTAHKQIHNYRIPMLFVSLVGYAPIAMNAGTVADCVTVSQSHANKSDFTSKTFDGLSYLSYSGDVRSTIDAVQAGIKVYSSTITTPSGTSLHPYEIIKNSLNDFLTFPVETEYPEPDFKEYVEKNFVLYSEEGSDKYWCIKNLTAEEGLGNVFYRNRTVSSMFSQLLLPDVMSHAVVKMLNQWINLEDEITYASLTTLCMCSDYTASPLVPNLSIVDFLTGIKEPGGISITVHETTPNTCVWHLLVTPEQVQDNRIKILNKSYNNFCDTITDKIIADGQDSQDAPVLNLIIKNDILPVFFANKDANGKLYTNPKQISKTF